MDKYTAPNLKKSALLTIDVQNDFTLPGAIAEIPGTYNIVPNIVRLLNVYRKNKFPIFHIVRIYKADGSNVDLCRREAVEKGKSIVRPSTGGIELVKELKPIPEVKIDGELLLSGEVQTIGDNEFIIYKPRWGAFYNTSLEKRLRELDRDTIVVVGCNFPNCPRTTIYEASERDYKLIAISDAISGIYDKGIAELENIGVEILSTDQLLRQLESFR